ncbi:hypothetical protein PMI01_04916, partial [Caulobacter sp. AP07]
RGTQAESDTTSSVAWVTRIKRVMTEFLS